MKQESRYVHQSCAIWWRIRFEYQPKEAQKIRAAIGGTNAAFEEINDVACQFGGRLKRAYGSDKRFALNTISRKSEFEARTNLKEKLSELAVEFAKLSLQNQTAIERALDQVYAGFKLTDFVTSAKILRKAIDQSAPISKIAGKKNEHYYWAVRELAEIWIKHRGQKPTIHHKVVPDGSKEGQHQKAAGPFIEFVGLTLQPVIEAVKTMLPNDTLPAPSLPAICRDFVSGQNRLMAKKAHIKRKTP